MHLNLVTSTSSVFVPGQPGPIEGMHETQRKGGHDYESGNGSGAARIERLLYVAFIILDHVAFDYRSNLHQLADGERPSKGKPRDKVFRKMNTLIFSLGFMVYLPKKTYFATYIRASLP